MLYIASSKHVEVFSNEFQYFIYFPDFVINIIIIIMVIFKCYFSGELIALTKETNIIKKKKEKKKEKKKKKHYSNKQN